MSDESYIQSLFADRLGGSQFGKDTKIYKFEKIKRAKRAAQDANPDKVLFVIFICMKVDQLVHSWK